MRDRLAPRHPHVVVQLAREHEAPLAVVPGGRPCGRSQVGGAGDAASPPPPRVPQHAARPRGYRDGRDGVAARVEEAQRCADSLEATNSERNLSLFAASASRAAGGQIIPSVDVRGHPTRAAMFGGERVVAVRRVALEPRPRHTQPSAHAPPTARRACAARGRRRRRAGSAPQATPPARLPRRDRPATRTPRRPAGHAAVAALAAGSPTRRRSAAACAPACVARRKPALPPTSAAEPSSRDGSVHAQSQSQSALFAACARRLVAVACGSMPKCSSVTTSAALNASDIVTAARQPSRSTCTSSTVPRAAKSGCSSRSASRRKAAARSVGRHERPGVTPSSTTATHTSGRPSADAYERNLQRRLEAARNAVRSTYRTKSLPSRGEGRSLPVVVNGGARAAAGGSPTSCFGEVI